MSAYTEHWQRERWERFGAWLLASQARLRLLASYARPTVGDDGRRVGRWRYLGLLKGAPS